MIVSTMESVPNQIIDKVIGVVTATNHTVTSDYKIATDEAVDALPQEAPKEAQAVIAVQVSFAQAGDDQVVAVAQGTAVTLKDIEERKVFSGEETVETEEISSKDKSEDHSTDTWDKSVMEVIMNHPEGLTPNEIAHEIGSLSLMEVAVVLRTLQEEDRIYKTDDNKYFEKIDWNSNSN